LSIQENLAKAGITDFFFTNDEQPSPVADAAAAAETKMMNVMDTPSVPMDTVSLPSDRPAA
jgi:hypothetical protein